MQNRNRYPTALLRRTRIHHSSLIRDVECCFAISSGLYPLRLNSKRVCFDSLAI